MKQGLLALSFALLLLAACTPQSETTTPQQPSLPDEPSAPSEAEQPTLPEPTTPKSDFPTPGEPDRTAFADFPTDVQDILKNAESRVGNGISYTYVKIANNLPVSELASESVVYQKGSTMKLVLNDDQVIKAVKDRDLYYDVAILDLEAKTVAAHCVDTKACRGSTGEREASYDDLIFPTPMYWYEQMSDPKKTSQDTIDGRSVYILDATVDDHQVEIAVDRFSGVPVRVIDGTTIYEYQKFALGVTDAQLKP